MRSADCLWSPLKAALCGLLALAITCGGIAAKPPQAYFLLTFDMLSHPGWPMDFRNYSLFIASPTHFTTALVNKVHRDIPGSRVLSYFDSISIPLKIGCSTGSPMGDNPVQRQLPDDPSGYYQSLRTGFNESILLRDLSKPGAQPYCLFPGLASYVLTKQSADFLVHFHADVTMARGFDGLYLDMLCDDYWCGANLETGLNENLTVFDINGDGVPNTLKDIQTQWKSWRPYFVAKLRGVLRADQLLIGNTAGPMSLPGLNGVTIEMEWCGTDMVACINAIEGSRAVSKHAPFDVFWLTQAQQVPPPTQCKLVYEMAGRFNDGSVFAGSDFFDGSHIVCNESHTG